MYGVVWREMRGCRRVGRWPRRPINEDKTPDGAERIESRRGSSRSDDG